MTIPRDDLVRLLRTILPTDLRPERDDYYNFDRDRALASFRWAMSDVGWNFSPDFDAADLATLARIAAGERWEGE